MECSSVESLVRRAMNNDPDAWGKLYEAVKQEVYFTALSVCRNKDDAEDMVQDTFVTAMGRIDQLDDPGKFRSWIKQIAANKSKDYLKKHKPMMFSDFKAEDDDPEPDWEDDREYSMPEQILDRAETSRLVQEIIGDLPEDQKICLTLYYHDELSVGTIAQALEVSDGTVKSRLNYARKKVKTKVLELEKMGTKLYGLAPIPFLVWLLKAEADATVVPAAVDTAVAGAIAAATAEAAAGSTAAAAGAVIGGAAANTATGVGAGTAVAGIKAVLSTTAAKIIAGVAAVGIISGSIAAVHEVTKAPQTPTDEIIWVYDDTSKTLTISGSGPMPDYTAEGTTDDLGGGALCSYPWSDVASETETVLIEEGVTCIGRNAFRDFRNLRCVVLPDSVTEIGDYAFYLCTSLTELNLPPGITRIGSYSFWNCTSLRSSLILPDRVSAIGEFAFARCTALTKAVIPNGVTELANGTFYYCLALSAVTIPDTVNYIGDTVFASCENLVDAGLPDGVTHIGNWAFMGCRNLTELTIPGSVTFIGEMAFTGCPALEGSEK